MSISTIVFDFGNVLGFFSHQKAAEQLSAYTHLSPEQIAAAYVDTDLEDDFEAGRITAAQFRDEVRRLCELRCTDEEFDRAVGDMFWVNEETCTLVPLLKARHRLVLLSNTNAIHANWFLKQFADTLAHFDHVVLSHEVQVRKPDPRIYQHACGKAGVCAGECLFIDDLPANIEAARACGWHGVVYRPGANLPGALASLGVQV